MLDDVRPEGPILEVVDEVVFRYPEDPGHRYVLPAGLTLGRGQAWCLYGVSGSGKSTLMTLLAGLRRLDRGCIRYHLPGTEPGAEPIELSARSWETVAGPPLWGRIGFAFQRPELIRALTVGDNLALMLGNGHRPGASLFTTEEWRGIAHSRVWKISGGQVQRLGLARAFGAGQPLVFLDEPTNNLDRSNRSAVAELVREQRPHRALVVVSHDEDFLARLGMDEVFEIQEQKGPGGVIDRTLVRHPSPSPTVGLPGDLEATPPPPETVEGGLP